MAKKGYKYPYKDKIPLILIFSSCSIPIVSHTLKKIKHFEKNLNSNYIRLFFLISTAFVFTLNGELKDSPFFGWFDKRICFVKSIKQLDFLAGRLYNVFT